MVKFIIKYGLGMEKRLLTYIPDECSFNMEPHAITFDFELILNKLSLSVINDKIVDISGFCGLNKSMASNYEVPENKQGALIVEHDLEFGYAYGINEKDWPISVNIKTGWVCIGNSKKNQGQAVEFIKNCIAVVDNNNNLVSLWLKPKTLPDF